MAVRWGSLYGPQALVMQLLGLVLIFVGERLIAEPGGLRLGLSGAGAGLCLLSLIDLGQAWLRSQDQARRVEGLAFLLNLIQVLALGIYALTSDLVGTPAERSAWTAVAWPILLVCGLVPAVFLQWSLASMGRGRGVEGNRVRASLGAGLSLSLFACTLFLLNAAVNKKDVHVDLSYFRTSSPSPSTLDMVAALEQDLELLLFFPEPNEVAEEVSGYFGDLAEGGSKLKLRRVDRDLEPRLAETCKVARAGTVVLRRGGSHQKIELGAKMKRAKPKLRKLDEAFQTALLKLTTKKQNVYVITGHDERGTRPREGDLRPKLRLLVKFLESKNLVVKPLGAMQGLTAGVPEDAALVVWAGPRKPLVPGEPEALRAYLDSGGRLLLLLDPESGAEPSKDLLAELGLEFHPEKLAHQRYSVPFTRTMADLASITSNKFSSHAATGFVSQHSRELAIVFPTCGHLSKRKEAKRRISFLVRAPVNTWADADGDLIRSPAEASRAFPMAAAVQQKIDKAQRAQAADEAPRLLDDEMRVVVFADADLFADPFLFFPGGNHYLLADVLRWLLNRRQVGGAANLEKDVPVVHSRDEDVFWFYGTVFIVPLGILGLGLVTGWGRGRSRRPSA